MDVELYWLTALSALSGATLLVSCWTAFRLRTRGVRATFGSGTTSGSAVTSEAHEHEFSERNPDKYGDDKRHCIAPGCGEPKPD